jgi:Spy/CpxP family protein refolding chaperone
MKVHRTVAVVLFPGVLAIAACGKDQSGGSGPTASGTASAVAASSVSATVMPSAMAPSPSAAAAASAAAFAAKGAMRRHVGLSGVLLRGAYELDLTPDQRTALDAAEDKLYADWSASPWAAMKAFNADVVAGIRASKLDTAKLSADYAAIDKAVQAGQAREVEALTALHGALDATQRQTLVDRVKAKRAARERTPETAPDGGAVDYAKRRLERLTLELGLDEAQQKSVAALLAKDPTLAPAAIGARRDVVRKRIDALFAEFGGDTFDPKKLNLTSEVKTSHEAAEHTAAFSAVILPILHPDQREKLALRTERMVNRPSRNFDDVEFGFGGMGPDEDLRMSRGR